MLWVPWQIFAPKEWIGLETALSVSTTVFEAPHRTSVRNTHRGFLVTAYDVRTNVKKRKVALLTEPSAGAQLEELKTFLSTYILIGPLLSALFAQHIDNFFFACTLFVSLVGTAFYWFMKRMAILEKSVGTLENKLAELSVGNLSLPVETMDCDQSN